ncbi:hypothetical protein KBB89_00235 [Candidatus Gracilibacteria bacterium]|nr:hypothetical protein [Candidatus Gracilibacteria bacterium]
MDTPLFPSQTEKHNAMISYCFLAIFMLISRQEQFTGKFVRSHARYATILHIGFLLLIITLAQTQSFSSVIIYDFTWIHAVLFILFFGLLALLGNGIYKALKGEKPRISLSEFTLKNFEKEFTDEISISKDEQTPIILSHIPFLGIYLAAKYGGKLSQGEKFGTWVWITGVVSVFIDPSLTLLIAIILSTMFWIVYQAVGSANTGTVNLLGNHLWSGRDVQISLQNCIDYAREIYKHEQKIPSWTEIEEKNRGKSFEYKKDGFSPFLYIPLVNIAIIIKIWKNNEYRVHMMQGVFITVLFLWGILSGTTAFTMLILIAAFWSYTQAIHKRDTHIPIIGKFSELVLGGIKFWKDRSKSEKIHLPTNK